MMASLAHQQSQEKGSSLVQPVQDWRKQDEQGCGSTQDGHQRESFGHQECNNKPDPDITFGTGYYYLHYNN
jgi:hypothetical protein